MKTVYKFLVLGIMMVAFAAANVAPSFAQDPQAEKEALYKRYTDNFKGTDDQKRIAIEAGKQYIEKYGASEDDKQVVDYLKKKVPSLEEEIGTKAMYASFNTAVKDPKTVNSDAAFSSGKQIIAKNPDLIDVPIVLASIGFDNAVAKNNKYNADAINYAKMAIQKIEAGKTSEQYGAYSYVYKTKEFPDGKSNALGWMNYTIGYIMFYPQGQKKDALPYLYKATQVASGTKNYPELYRTIGSFYVDEFIRLDKERVDKIKAAGNVDTEETKSLLALQKGYADRAVEAYAKAYRVASSDPKEKAYKDSLLTRVKELYAIRFDNKMDGFDAFLSSTATKPLTDPTTAVAPVVEATPSTTSSAPSTATKMTNTTEDSMNTVARPSNASATAASAKSTTPAAAATTKAATKTPAKKPAAKKKGTR
jgi:hypothetical protein